MPRIIHLKIKIMKISNSIVQTLLSGVIFLFTTLGVLADYSVSVEHMHNGRVHTHQL